MPKQRGTKRAQHRKKTAPRPPEVLDVQGIAALLTVSTDTVYDLLASGELPGRKVGRKWRTTRNVVIRWLEQSMTAESAKRVSRADDSAALRAVEQGDRAALAKALQSGAVRVRAA